MHIFLNNIRKVLKKNKLVNGLYNFFITFREVITQQHKREDLSIGHFFIKSAFYHLRGKHIFAHPRTTIIGLENLYVEKALQIGTWKTGFLGRNLRTVIINAGRMNVLGYSRIGMGCRIEVGENATIKLDNCSLNSESDFIIHHSLEIRDGTTISWGCQFLDTDFHNIEYDGREKLESGIVIGNHVWVGNHVTIMKGVHIGNGSVIAANSVVLKSFPNENVLIGGYPAKIIKENVWWS